MIRSYPILLTIYYFLIGFTIGNISLITIFCYNIDQFYLIKNIPFVDILVVITNSNGL